MVNSDLAFSAFVQTRLIPEKKVPHLPVCHSNEASEGRMKVCKICSIEKSSAEFRKSKTTKDRLHSYCIKCHRQKIRDNYNEKKEHYIQMHRDYYYTNHESEKAKRRIHYRKNKEQYLVNYYLREEKIKQATPVWLSDEMFSDIKVKYKIAKRLTTVHNIQYHVDHIIPIQGKNVCGLNVPWNLQIILAKENMKKGNKHD